MQEIYQAVVLEFDWDGQTFHNETYHTTKLLAYKRCKEVYLNLYTHEFNKYKRGKFNFALGFQRRKKVWKFEENKRFYITKIEITD